MNFKIKNINIIVSYYFLILISLIISTDKSNISMYFLYAIVIHECGHLLFIYFFNIKISAIHFKVYGINISIAKPECISYCNELLILLSGSFANFIISILLYFINSTEYFILITTNLIIGVFNLLPIESLDGGKIINIILFSCLPFNVAYNISFFISVIFICTFSVIDFFFILHGNFNITLSVLCIILILKIIRNNM